MLYHITWHQYLTAVLVVAVIYYAIVIYRCYQPEWQRIVKQLNGSCETGYLPEALQYQAETEKAANNTASAKNLREQQEYQQAELAEYDHLAAELKGCIAKAADKPFAPDSLIPQLKKILKAQPETTGQTDRQLINELIVNECEKTGTAMLTEDEVDQWWSD